MYGRDVPTSWFVKKLVKRLLPSSAWNRLRSMKTAGIQRLSESAGYVVDRTDNYYSPLTSVARLKSTRERWCRPSTLGGIEYDIEQMQRDLSALLSRYLEEFCAIPPYEQLQKMGFGPGYTAVDALTLYMMVRHLKPRRYIEVGSGLSTYYCSLAAQRNAAEGHVPLDITCMEPYPFEKLYTIPGIRVIPNEVQELELSLFRQLQADDILFIDSSHVLKIDGDVPFLYLEVLPQLNPGVVIHGHDVPFPYNIPYPPQLWILGQEWPMFWNEAI